MANPAVKELTDEQLAHQVLEGERELMAARFRLSMNQLENSAQLKVIRRDIARLRTEARTREIANDLPKDSLISIHGKTFTPGEAPVVAAEAEKGGFLSGIVDKLTGNE